MAAGFLRWPRRNIVIGSFLFLVIVIVAVFPPVQLQQWLKLSLTPPENSEVLSSDIFKEDQRPLLTSTFLSAWLTILLLTSAICFYCFSHSLKYAFRWWLVFWSASLCVFLIHLGLATDLFGRSWHAILHSSRLTLHPYASIVIALIWIFDVAFAWINIFFHTGNRYWLGFVRIERLILHQLLFTLFLIASVKEGELLLSKVFGFVMVIAVTSTFVIVLYPALKSGWNDPFSSR
jgi:hypothetical protein